MNDNEQATDTRIHQLMLEGLMYRARAIDERAMRLPQLPREEIEKSIDQEVRELMADIKKSTNIDIVIKKLGEKYGTYLRRAAYRYRCPAPDCLFKGKSRSDLLFHQSEHKHWKGEQQ